MKDWKVSFVLDDAGKYLVFGPDGIRTVKYRVDDITVDDLPERRLRVRYVPKDERGSPCVWIGSGAREHDPKRSWRTIGYYPGREALAVALTYLRMFIP